MGARSAVCNKEIRQPSPTENDDYILCLKTKTNSACACDDCKSKKKPSPLKSNKIEPPSVTKDIVAIIAADNKGLVADLIEQYLID